MSNEKLYTMLWAVITLLVLHILFCVATAIIVWPEADKTDKRLYWACTLIPIAGPCFVFWLWFKYKISNDQNSNLPVV